MSTHLLFEPDSTGVFDPAAVVTQCVESGAQALLLDRHALPPAFFDLSSGVLGDLVHRLTRYRIRMAAVVPDVAAHSLPFQDSSVRRTAARSSASSPRATGRPSG